MTEYEYGYPRIIPVAHQCPKCGMIEITSESILSFYLIMAGGGFILGIFWSFIFTWR